MFANRVYYYDLAAKKRDTREKKCTLPSQASASLKLNDTEVVARSSFSLSSQIFTTVEKSSVVVRDGEFAAGVCNVTLPSSGGLFILCWILLVIEVSWR